MLRSEVIVPREHAEVFRFFSDARNLDSITPPFLRFRILTEAPIEMRSGAVIDYALRLRGLPIRWRTLISAWEPPNRFVDEQVRGPYRMWHHEHLFEPCPEGTRCIDIVNYRHWGGRFIERCLVRPDLERIFSFRRRRLLELLTPGVRPRTV